MRQVGSKFTGSPRSQTVSATHLWIKGMLTWQGRKQVQRVAEKPNCECDTPVDWGKVDMTRQEASSEGHWEVKPHCYPKCDALKDWGKVKLQCVALKAAFSDNKYPQVLSYQILTLPFSTAIIAHFHHCVNHFQSHCCELTGMTLPWQHRKTRLPSPSN